MGDHDHSAGHSGFFGANKIPDIARGLGKGIREFKDATKEIKDEIENNSVRLDK